MVRKSLDRARRYKAKINGDVIGKTFSQLKEEMRHRQGAYLVNAVKIEQEIKSMLKDESVLNVVYYIIFAKEIAKLKAKYSGEALLKELEILQFKWKERMLDEEKLIKIKQYYLPSYTPPVPVGYFLLDVSLLDGPDVLA